LTYILTITLPQSALACLTRERCPSCRYPMVDRHIVRVQAAVDHLAQADGEAVIGRREVPITLISRQRLAFSRSTSSKGPKKPMRRSTARCRPARNASAPRRGTRGCRADLLRVFQPGGRGCFRLTPGLSKLQFPNMTAPKGQLNTAQGWRQTPPTLGHGFP
jgi:hypothetical protein